MTNPEWVALTDAERGQLVSIWLLAAGKKGNVPDSPILIQRMAMLETTPNISKFIDLGWLETNGLPDGSQVVVIEVETETETETEKKESRQNPSAKKTTRKKPKTKGTRLSKEWRPSVKLLEWAANKREDLDLEDTVENFIDYWISKTGQAATKLDWDATFRSWVRNERQGNIRSGKRETTVQARTRRNRAAIEAAKT
jgi:hypothetical protein